ncbi:DNA-binding transcriptional regulator [Xylella fastidiosa]|uniref:DNA-binding transcriptional regulator n=2 Tax=Xylella fastidiosa TaxID=2371 RepID=A0ABC8AGM1_XYLFS|nr:DNA-binding transcriptional regulator [Xylella fastidiosa]
MYHYTESGLGNVWLRNGFTVHKTPYGDGIAIDNLPGLHRSLSLALALKPATLSGAEIRFMRKELELSQPEFAACLGTTRQTLAAWEEGRAALPNAADKMIRVLINAHYKR